MKTKQTKQHTKFPLSIKISMACVYKKPAVKKNDTTAVTTATNEASIDLIDQMKTAI